MQPQNIDLLQSQEALQKLAKRDLRGVFALRLADILDEVRGRLQKLQGVQEDLSRRVDEGDLQQPEADEQWRELLEETCEIDAEPIPRSAVRTIEISVADLNALGWLFEEREPESPNESDP
jgi:hypothetical protein